MTTLLSHLPEIALAAALAWGSGLRLYAVLFLSGMSAQAGWLELPTYLAGLAHPLVLGASGFMTLVEFGADKLPWLDSLWDAIHTFIRVPAGAALAGAVFGANDASVALTAAILGGTIAAGTHLTKAGARATINTSPEPVSNWFASFSEDLLVPAGLWLSVVHPAAFLAMFVLFAIAAVLLLRKITAGLAALVRGLRTRKVSRV
ncbi:MAG: DUF4126 domain-containing protein [Betaproteobacteria bacterium]|nr:DUF4126 domain-containing protein [Betaproteobacteria bacterium]